MVTTQVQAVDLRWSVEVGPSLRGFEHLSVETVAIDDGAGLLAQTVDINELCPPLANVDRDMPIGRTDPSNNVARTQSRVVIVVSDGGLTRRKVAVSIARCPAHICNKLAAAIAVDTGGLKQFFRFR